MPASLKIGVWFPQEGLGRYTSREAPWKRDWDEGQTPSEITYWATAVTWFWSRRNLPNSWLQYAAIQCQRWSGRWCSVGRKLLLQLCVQSKSSIYPHALTLPLFSTSLSAPRASVAQALLNSPKPPMGRYSLSSCLAAMSASALIKEGYTFKILTTGVAAFPNVGGGGYYLPDTAEHERFALVVSVGSNPQVHLLRVAIPLEGLSHSQDGIRWAHLNSTPPGAARTPAVMSQHLKTVQ